MLFYSGKLDHDHSLVVDLLGCQWEDEFGATCARTIVYGDYCSEHHELAILLMEEV